MSDNGTSGRLCAFVYILNRKMRITDILNNKIKKMNIMDENKKKPYMAPSMKVYEIGATQLLAGSSENVLMNTSVNEWNDGYSLGSHEL